MEQVNSQQKLKPVQRLWGLLRPDRKEITNIYVYAVFNGLVYLSIPLGIQAIVNFIQAGQVSTSWIVLITFVILGIALTGVLQIQQMRITENLQQKIFTRAAFEFAHRIPKIKLEGLYKHYAPELINRFFDIISVQKGLSKMLIDFSVAILQIVFGLILLSAYHPFFIAFAFVLVFLVFAIFRFTVTKGLKTGLSESNYKYQVAYWLQELARTNTTFKLVGKTEMPLERVDGNTKGYLKFRESHFKVLVQQFSLMVVFKVLIGMGLLIIGSLLVMENEMNIGQFVAAEIIILMIMNSAEKLIASAETIYDVFISLEKLGQVTDLELDTKEGIDLREECDACGLKVEFKNLDFSYPGTDKNVLNKINLKIDSDERIMIKGSNGSGKSTLLQLLAGLYDPSGGQLTFNELPKNNIRLSSLHSVIGDSLSQEQLFQGTVLENINMGREDVSFENVKWAVKNLGLQNFIKGLPEGYNTVLNSAGKHLAESTIRKLLLARAIAAKPKLLILEDVFVQIDEDETKRIIDFLTDKENRWTLVMASRNAYLEQKSDRTLVLKEGRIDDNSSTNINA